MSQNSFKVKKSMVLKPTSRPSSPEEGEVYYDSSSNEFFIYSNAAWSSLSASDFSNYIGNGDAEVDTSGWATYADAAQSRPVNGTGGTANVTFTRSTTTPLKGAGSFIFTKDAANRQGQGVSYDFSIARSDQAKILNISFDYQINSGTFVAGTDSTDSDLIVYMYDVTNSLLIEPLNFKLLSNSSTAPTEFQGSFQSASNSTSYRLILHVASTSASAYSLKIDNVAIKPQDSIFINPITGWKEYSLVVGATTTAPTFNGTIVENRAIYRQIGDSLEIMYSLHQSTAGTAGSGTYLFPIPTGFTIDTNKINLGLTTELPVLGPAQATNSSGYVVAYNTTNLALLTLNSTNNLTLVSDSYFGAGGGVTYGFKATVPVVELASSVEVPNYKELKSINSSVSRTGADQSIPDATETKVEFNTINYNVLNAFDTTTSRYTLPVAGKYKFSGQLSFNVTTAQFACYLVLYKNGSALKYHHFSKNGSANLVHGIPFIFYDEGISGDYYEIFIFQSSGSSLGLASSGIAFGNELLIEKIQNSLETSALKTVAVKAYDTAGTTVTTTPTAIPFATVDLDTDNAFASGIFTAPIAGIYQISSNIFTTSTLSVSDTLTMYVYKNGSILQALNSKAGTGASNTTNCVGVSTIVNLNSGDTLTVSVSVDSGTLTLASASGFNQLSINRI